ncbi:GNAT family N-acetyltransferase [Vibrio rhodolitus]|uniref:GNAT family N-acetyltransferase n=1 Tax=Vibrio rhodolitus TaxID=2231649 RepID=UPI000E0CBC08|nr:GNAT family N-acetyltransferase [Vibrio rhodolitus]
MEYKEISSIAGYEIDLRELLIDSVEDGASIGFVLPIDSAEVDDYWLSVEADLREGERRLYVAIEQQHVVGAVQLSLCSKANGQHRGEVEKLMVKTQQRGKGISKQLMSMMEHAAKEQGVSLLVLDTRKGDVASSLYQSIGYQQAGEIPQFALSSNGTLDGTIYFYKLLG